MASYVDWIAAIYLKFKSFCAAPDVGGARNDPPPSMIVNRLVARVIGIQIAVTGVAIVPAALLAGTPGAASAAAGGAIGFLPSAVYAAILALASRGGPERQLQASYAAEAVKVVLTLLLFALAFAAFRELRFWPLFLTYLGTLAAYWIALWLDQPVTQEK